MIQRVKETLANKTFSGPQALMSFNQQQSSATPWLTLGADWPWNSTTKVCVCVCVLVFQFSVPLIIKQNVLHAAGHQMRRKTCQIKCSLCNYSSQALGTTRKISHLPECTQASRQEGAEKFFHFRPANCFIIPQQVS